MKIPILIIILFSVSFLSAQVSKPLDTTIDSSTATIRISDYNVLWKEKFQNLFSDSRLLLQVPSATLLTCSPNHLPGLFCKMEYKIETKSKLAPRFRLGSLNYTNWMEGKGSIYSRYWN
ncbi:MAG: hypothetical protein IPP15_19050 [Saprospiraceae bacterium]|uniref:Uncharacterized protein n=1 Tax=Candidatus Opimibacter skivensis TaxID=2982028 RepID=A0A9D7SWA0_9BACT|nr:hypothetical protein [Candidatus Opimibacter skivensis]